MLTLMIVLIAVFVVWAQGKYHDHAEKKIARRAWNQGYVAASSGEPKRLNPYKGAE